MKTKITVLAFLALLFTVRMNAQESVQIFASAGFKVRCGCQFTVNSVFINMAKQQGANNIIGAYICAENKDSYDNGVIYNINVYDESGSYSRFKPENYPFFEKKCLESYAKNLANAGFTYSYVTYKGVTALEYTFDQMGMPTKAIMFYKNKKSYLVQAGTRDNVMRKFEALKAGFELM